MNTFKNFKSIDNKHHVDTNIIEDIAWFNSRNAAIEAMKVDSIVKEGKTLKELISEYYEDWVNFRNEADERSDVKKCPNCGSPAKLIPAGKSKKTGRHYEAFYACDNCKWSESVEIKKPVSTPKGAVEAETPTPPEVK